MSHSIIDQEVRATGSSKQFHAMAMLLWLLPHFAIPAVTTYRPPAASLFIVLWAVFALIQPNLLRLQLTDPGALRKWLILFFAYCLLSTLYGYWNLSDMGKLTLHLTTGDVHYLRTAGERLLQVALVIVTFEVVRHSRHSSRDLMRWWLQGTAGAVLFHALTYAITGDVLVRRAGTFIEGNLAGLYYLLSVFVALEYRRIHSRKVGTRILLVALIGVILSQSTASIMLLGLLLAVNYVLGAKSIKWLTWRTLIVFLVVPSFAIAMISSGRDFGILEKLFEQEITPSSFSRIDRLESIRAAVRIFAEAPVLGQGLQTYGFLSNDLLEGPLLAMYDASFRRIPNNVYAELAAELGVTGLLLMVGFLLSLIWLVVRRGGAGRRHLLLGIFSVLVYWNAFPTYSVVFIWVYFGMVIKSLNCIKPWLLADFASVLSKSNESDPSHKRLRSFS